MKICVLMKQVASEDSPLKINDDKQTIDSVSLNLNLLSYYPYDSGGKRVPNPF